jgi:hypothetical protein
MYHLRAQLGDGDDVLNPVGFNLLSAGGGPGNDRLLGGTWSDELDGGGGIDELHGGEDMDIVGDGDESDGAPPDADVLDGGPGEDWVSYENRTGAVTVDLTDPGTDGAPGEGDALTGIENVHGGRGDDRLIGDRGNNRFADQGGRNRMIGKRGDDVFRDAASGVVRCGPGDDTVRGVTRHVLLAQGCEVVARRAGDFDFAVTAYPRREGAALSVTMDCPTFDGEPIHCAGTVTIRSGDLPVAHGVIDGTERQTVTLSVEPPGAARLERGALRATIWVLGDGFPDMAWGLELPRLRGLP